RQFTCGFETIPCQWTFDNDIRRDLRILTSFTNHALQILAGYFSRDGSLNDFTNRGDVLLEVYIAFLCNKRWIRGHSVGKTQCCAFANVVEISGIKKEFHNKTPIGAAKGTKYTSEGNYDTRFTRVPIPLTSTSTVSPCFIRETPAGVPVAIRSPGYSVMISEMYLIRKATENAMSAVLPFCFTSPLRRVWTVTLRGSISVSSHGPTGQKVSNDLPRVNW